MKIQQSFTKKKQNKGKLYLVGTPIGNLEDMTYRAVRILSEVDWIAAEDTRQTKKLLNHYQIETRLMSYHEHNKEQSGAEVINRIQNGANIALVSDAGMPAISDPGYELVKLAVHKSVHVIPVPGANAALSALVASGMKTEAFTFIGFLPRERKRMKERLTELSSRTETLIIYESPHRIQKTLKLMVEVWGHERMLVLAREVTKRYEEFARGSLADGLKYIEEMGPPGEFCLIVEGVSKKHEPKPKLKWQLMSLAEHYQYYIEQGVERKEAMRQVAKERSVSRRDVYNQLNQR